MECTVCTGSVRSVMRIWIRGYCTGTVLYEDITVYCILYEDMRIL